jgi:hypothetical protein
MSFMQWRHSLEDRVLRSVVKLTDRAQRRFIRPCLMDLQPFCEEAFVDARAMLQRLCPSLDPARLQSLRNEHRELGDELKRRYRERDLAFPPGHAIAEGTSFLLYALARIRRPRTVVETGVANGHSTYYLLRALGRNGRGRLVSFDVSARAGSLLSNDERRVFDLRLLPKRRPESAFARQIEALPDIDLFHHDSLHSYDWQTLEYETIRRCCPEALMTSEDVDGSFAFVDFCERHGRKALYLIDTRKVFGVIA